MSPSQLNKGVNYLLSKQAGQSAVIVKGNPDYVNNNPQADKFYGDLGSFLQSQQYDVSYDAGLPHTEPQKANLWLGHSRGADRLRWAPPSTKTISMGAMGGINHPRDKSMLEGNIPDKYHYQLTSAMKRAILAKLQS